MEMNKASPPLIASQKWKLWIWGLFFAIAGLGLLIPDRLAVIFSISPIAINIGAGLIGFLALGGVSLTIRCPQCGLRLAWYSLSHKSISGWLSWLLEVTSCPQCAFSDKITSRNSKNRKQP